jgi:RNA polymerase sigma-70 factor (ECF subfamily)
MPVTEHAQDADEMELLAGLRAGDERAFATLVERYHLGMIRFAQQYVPDRSIAEDVAQEAWLQVLRGLERFEGRSTLKTWIFGIVLNCARARARRDRRTVPFSVVASMGNDPFEPAVEASRFRAPGEQYAGRWVSFPASWGDAPDRRMLAAEARRYLQDAIDALPPNQREVVVLRDVQGMSAEQACTVLQLSDSNQRVLLHRGRSKLRRAIAHYLVRE